MLISLLMSLAQAEPPNLEGAWAMRTHSESEAKLPVLGKIRASSETFALAYIRKVDGVWQQEHKACKVTTDGGSLVSTRLPDAYSANLPGRKYPLSVTESDGGWRVASDWGQMAYGWIGTCANMPVEEDEPCVEDSDKDGHPGVTLNAKLPLFAWVEIYMAQTTHVALSGKVDSVDLLSGVLDIKRSDSNVLAASNRLFTRDPPQMMP
ncbi:MAG: hypothetical protein GWP91_12550, partial [Rhodobacterales bacterium]|nr:hypothetical protein [Rhodobacterales bacterium]